MAQPNKNRGLLSLSDDELRRRYEASNDLVLFSSNDYYGEIQRRTQNRHALAIRRLTTVTVVLAVITALLGIGAFVMEIAGAPRGACPSLRGAPSDPIFHDPPSETLNSEQLPVVPLAYNLW